MCFLLTGAAPSAGTIPLQQLSRFPTRVRNLLAQMLRNNPPDVVYAAFSQAFFKGAIDLFQRDNEMKNIVLTDAQVREQAIRHFFNRALREVRESKTSV